MSSSLVLEGVGLTMVAGLMSGSCMVPMKFARRWKWENVWLVFSIVSLLILPWALAFGLVNRLMDVYRSVPMSVMVAPLLLGAGWGVAQILFGITVRRLGLGVGYGIIVGLGAVLGTLVPLFLGQTAYSRMALLKILTGVVVMIVGITLTTWGGQIRERAGRAQAPASFQEQGYAAAVALAVLCGVMAPMLNYAFVFGQGLAVAAVKFGSTPAAAAYAVWPVALMGGLVPNIAYSLYRLQRNRTWAAFNSGGADPLWAVLMAGLWMGAFALYGVSAVYLGGLGTSVGWGLFQIFMIVTATVTGVITAEWKSAPRRAIVLLSSGMAGLLGATVLLSMGSYQ